MAEGRLRDLRIATRELRSYTDQRGDLLRRFRSHAAQEGVSLPKSWHTSKKKRKAARAQTAAVKGERAAALKALRRQIQRLAKEINRWRKRVEELCRGFEAVQTMIAELPGMGSIIAGTIYAELGEPARFYSVRYKQTVVDIHGQGERHRKTRVA